MPHTFSPSLMLESKLAPQNISWAQPSPPQPAIELELCIHDHCPALLKPAFRPCVHKRTDTRKLSLPTPFSNPISTRFGAFPSNTPAMGSESSERDGGSRKKEYDNDKTDEVRGERVKSSREDRSERHHPRRRSRERETRRRSRSPDSRHRRSRSRDRERRRNKERDPEPREPRDGATDRDGRGNHEDGPEGRRDEKRFRRERDREPGYGGSDRDRDRDSQRRRSPESHNSRRIAGPEADSRQTVVKRSGPLPSQGDAFAVTSGVEPEKPVEKPNFRATGVLAAASNTVTHSNGSTVVLKYHEPPEARKPSPRDVWKMFVFKGADIIDTIELSTRSCWLIGRDSAVVDLPAEHPSISKQHAVIQFRYIEKRNEYGDKIGRVKPYLIDLESANGTILNNDKVPDSRYLELKNKDMIQLGSSTREYVLMLAARD
jgi:smad nuclear-interacting protein 1